MNSENKIDGKLPIPENCPYRAGSYRICYAILAYATEKWGGCSRRWLTRELSRRSKIDLLHSSWNTSVVCSRKAPDDTGHRSSKSCYWVETTGEGFLRLRRQD